MLLHYGYGEERINIDSLEGGREVPDTTYRVRDRIPESSIEWGVPE